MGRKSGCGSRGTRVLFVVDIDDIIIEGVLKILVQLFEPLLFPRNARVKRVVAPQTRTVPRINRWLDKRVIGSSRRMFYVMPCC